MADPESASRSSSARRTTKQRTAVVTALSTVHDFRSAQQIHDLVASRGERVGLTTVYRALQTLSADGDVDVIVADDGEARYRLCSGGHHHHLVCRRCGTTVEVAGPTVERWAEKVAAEHGFTEPGHTIEITGLCPRCQAAIAAGEKP
jgi:Fur family ferric uptake transcriptional regulator